MVLTPIFFIFIASHLIMIVYGLSIHIKDTEAIFSGLKGHLNSDINSIGILGVSAIFLHAFSLGGGTFTGIEAVSNGLQLLREPRAENGKRTMLYMALSLSITASGLYIYYLLLKVVPTEGVTLNSIVANAIFGNWLFGKLITLVTIFSEGALLVVAAQAGFLDGPRVMANMAIDSWFPYRFSSLSERLTLRNGILLMGLSALSLLIYTKGKISILIVMYSINVFITFSLSIGGMALATMRNRKNEKRWFVNFIIEIIGVILCLTILIITTIEKFSHGGWLTLILTAILIALCYSIRRHYKSIQSYIRKIDDQYKGPILQFKSCNISPVDRDEATAIQLVSGFNGFGIHTFFSINKNFPKLYKNFIFVSVAVIDSGTFKGAEELERLLRFNKSSLENYVDLSRRYGIPAEYRIAVGTDVVEEVVKECVKISNEFKKSTVFTGQLTFSLEKWYHKLLHNQTAFAIQRRLQIEGITTIIMPINVEDIENLK